MFQFGQRNNMPKGEYFTEFQLYSDLMFDPTVKITNICPVNEDLDMLFITYKKKDEFVDPLGNTSVVVAAFTTGNARLELYKHIEKLGDRTFYYDTG